MELPTLPITSKKILVIEEDDETRENITRSLEFEGYFVIQARDGQNALEIVQKITPHLILSTILTPGFNGLEFYKSVRNDPKLVTIPFIFITSDQQEEATSAGRNEGVEDHIKKPIRRDELVKIVNARMLRAAQLEIAHVNRAYLETVTVLANTIESRDQHTYEHIERVAKGARLLAENLHLSDEEMRNLEFGARLHDIGKIIIPDHILNKGSKLTPEEWSLMRQHPIAGAKILSGISHLRGAVPYVLYHHERWDGSGYPMGLKGLNIPLAGRIMAIADVFDALVNERPYHPARPKAEVLVYLKMRSGIHFDPDLTDSFISIMKSKM